MTRIVFTKEGDDPKKVVSLPHDVRIALSALNIGATITADNGKDFLAIRKVTGVQFASPCQTSWYSPC